MAEETKRYLDYDGLAHLVELLTNRIQAVGGDGKYLPLTGGEISGDLKVDGQTTLNRTGINGELTLGDDCRVNVGTEETFPEPADIDGSDRVLVLHNGMVCSFPLSQVAQWVVDNYGGGSSSGFEWMLRYDWDVSLVNEADEAISDPLKIGLCFADSQGLTEPADFDAEGEIIWGTLAESIGMNGVDADGGLDTSNYGSRGWRWFGGIVIQTPTHFVTDGLRMDIWGDDGSGGGFSRRTVGTWDGVEGNLQVGETVFLPCWTDLQSLDAGGLELTFYLGGQINLKGYNN